MSLNFSLLVHRKGPESLHAGSSCRAQWDDTDRCLDELSHQRPYIARQTYILMVMTSRHYEVILHNDFVIQTGVFRQVSSTLLRLLARLENKS